MYKCELKEKITKRISHTNVWNFYKNIYFRYEFSKCVMIEIIELFINEMDEKQINKPMYKYFRHM